MDNPLPLYQKKKPLDLLTHKFSSFPDRKQFLSIDINLLGLLECAWLLKKKKTVITIFEILEIRNKFRIPKMYARQATNIDIETLQPPSSQMVEGSLEVEEDAQVGM